MSNTDRFSNRVANYVKFRPNYPPQVIGYLSETVGLASHHTVADIGSGTGISSEPFLRNGNTVLGVEPNGPMREAAETLLGNFEGFTSVNGTAEATGLAAHSADFVVVGTAIHWFNLTQAATEFRRILKPNGVLVIMWNERDTDDAFQKAYDQLLHERAIDYTQVGHRNITDDKVAPLFVPAKPCYTAFANAQSFDWESLLGRALSSSYTPPAQHPAHAWFVTGLRDLFDAHAQNGQVGFTYKTKLYTGRLETA